VQYGHFPKGQRFGLGQRIIDAALDTCGHVIEANNIWPTNAGELQTRKDYFMKAIGELKKLDCFIGLADGRFGIDKNIIQQWSEKINEEMRLIQGVMETDKKRWSFLNEPF